MTRRVMTTLALMALLPMGARAYEAALSSSSQIWLEGDSTLHPYSSTATSVALTLSLEPAAGAPDEAAAALARKAPARMSLSIPVKGLKSGHSGLDKNLQQALNADTHPDIAFTLSTYTVTGGRIAAEGRLSIAGAERTVSVDAALNLRDGRLFLEGEKPLLMSEFGVKPPKMMFGAVKTADRVVVKFRLELEKAGDSAENKKRGELK